MTKRPTILTVMGILTIAFGSVGVLAGCCSIAGFAFMGVMNRKLAEIQQNVDAQRQSRQQKYQDDLAAATTDDERADIEKDYRDWEKTNPSVDIAAINAYTRDARFIGHVVVDGVLSFVTNVLLIVAGAGLLKMRPGARRLGIGTAAAKIVINLLAGLYSLLVILPLQNESMAPFMEKIQEMPGQPMGLSWEVQQTMGKVGAVVGMLSTLVFPAVVVIVLSLASVRRALEPTSSSPPPGI